MAYFIISDPRCMTRLRLLRGTRKMRLPIFSAPCIFQNGLLIRGDGITHITKWFKPIIEEW